MKFMKTVCVCVNEEDGGYAGKRSEWIGTKKPTPSKGLERVGFFVAYLDGESMAAAKSAMAAIC